MTTIFRKIKLINFLNNNYSKAKKNISLHIQYKHYKNTKNAYMKLMPNTI